ALPAGQHDPRPDRQLRHTDAAPVPAEYRVDRGDAPLLPHLLGDTAVRALRADGRRRKRPLLRRPDEQRRADRVAPLRHRLRRAGPARHTPDLAVGAPHRAVSRLVRTETAVFCSGFGLPADGRPSQLATDTADLTLACP